MYEYASSLSDFPKISIVIFLIYVNVEKTTALSINLSVTEAGPSKNEYVCIEVSSRKRVAIAMVGCWYQSHGRGRPVAGPSKCPPLGVIPTCIETMSENSSIFSCVFGDSLKKGQSD